MFGNKGKSGRGRMKVMEKELLYGLHNPSNGPRISVVPSQEE